jgi:thioredoxin 1
MSENAKYISLDECSFQTEVLLADRPVLVDFWADWCPPCRIVAPVIEELAEEFDGAATVAKLDVDKVPSIAGAYEVRSIPTLLFFRNGEVVDRVVGAVPKEVLAQKLNSLMASA